MTNKGFMNLNDAALQWLGGNEQIGGRIIAIDVQKGCPWQCIGCGVCAPKKTENMKWSDYMIISDSILEVLAKKRIDILTDDRVDPFYTSDSPFYHSKDGNSEKTAYHIVNDLLTRHLKDVGLTTAGWTPGNNYMQRAMEDIVNNYSSNEARLLLSYSIKSATISVIKEYNKFLDQNPGINAHNRLLNKKILEQSRYISRIINNLETLAPLNHLDTIVFGLQCFDPEIIKKLDSKYDRYQYLFSENFMLQTQNYIIQHWKNNPPKDESGIPYKAPPFTKRSFEGIGNVLNMGDVTPSLRLLQNRDAIDSNSKEKLDENDYFAQITCEGNIEIYYGIRHYLSSKKVSKEHFIRLAQNETDPLKREEYRMLSELHGTNVLR